MTGYQMLLQLGLAIGLVLKEILYIHAFQHSFVSPENHFPNIGTKYNGFQIHEQDCLTARSRISRFRMFAENVIKLFKLLLYDSVEKRMPLTCYSF
jgi:hypothetical protein